MGIALDAMHRIKKISAEMLAEKTKDNAVALSDTEAKRDIMSLLVRARNADLAIKSGYTMTDQQMMDQVVRPYSLASFDGAHFRCHFSLRSSEPVTKRLHLV